MVKLAHPMVVKSEDPNHDASPSGRGVESSRASLTGEAPASSPVAPTSVAPQAGSGPTSGAPQAGSLWKVGRRATACGACARAFDEGSLVFSAIFLEELAGSEVPAVRRVDRCGLCHPKRERQALEIHWRTQF